VSKLVASVLVTSLAQKAAGEKADVGQALSSAIATLGYAVGQEAIGVSRRGLFHEDPARAAVQAASQANEALRATKDAQALAEIGTAVSEAKTTQQVPDAMKNLVELATGNDPNAQVYFQTKDWDEHFQSAGASPAKAVADITGDDGKAYYEAKSTGSPIVLSLADYVARVANTDHWEPLLKLARTKPDGMSLAEASDYLSSLPKTMEEIATSAGAENAPAVPTLPEASAAKVRETSSAAQRAGSVAVSRQGAVGALRSCVPDAGRAVGCGSPRAVQSLQPQDQERERATAKGEAGSSATFRGRSRSSHRSHRQSRECDRA
jgi:hypothetical protein